MASSRSSNAIQAPSCACKRRCLSVIVGIQKTPLSRRFLDVVSCRWEAQSPCVVLGVLDVVQGPSQVGEERRFGDVSDMDASLGIIKAPFRHRFGAAAGVLSPMPPRHQLEDDWDAVLASFLGRECHSGNGKRLRRHPGVVLPVCDSGAVSGDWRRWRCCQHHATANVP